MKEAFPRFKVLVARVTAKSLFLTFIGSLFKLAVIRSLLNQIQNCGSQFGRGKRIGLGSIVILPVSLSSRNTPTLILNKGIVASANTILESSWVKDRTAVIDYFMMIP